MAVGRLSIRICGEMAAEVAVGHEERGGESSKWHQPCRVGVANLPRAGPDADLIVKNPLWKSDDPILGLVRTRCIWNFMGRAICGPGLLLRRLRGTPIDVRRNIGDGRLPECDRRCRQKAYRPDPSPSHKLIQITSPIDRARYLRAATTSTSMDIAGNYKCAGCDRSHSQRRREYCLPDGRTTEHFFGNHYHVSWLQGRVHPVSRNPG